jgi:hypothetical protein
MPTIDLSSLMACPLPMQVEDVQWSNSPIVQADVGQVATSVTATLEGFISCADPAALATAIAAISGAQVSGQDFNVSGGGVVLYQLLASDCYENGPHIAFEILGGEGGGYRKVRATVAAKAFFASFLSAYRRRITTRSDGLLQIEQTGTITAPDPGSQFPAVLTDFQTTYNSSSYVSSWEVSTPTATQQVSGGSTTHVTDFTCQYRISAEQLATALPTGGGCVVVDGEATTSTDRNEQQRLVTRTEYRLTLKPNTGSYTDLVAALRPTTGSITDESVRFSKIKGWNLECAFTVLSSADGDGLLAHTRSLKITGNNQAYDVYTYPGATPIAVAKPTTLARISQSGTSTAAPGTGGTYPAAESPVVSYFADQPSVTRTAISKYEVQTAWNYELIDVDGAIGADLAAWLTAMVRT